MARSFASASSQYLSLVTTVPSNEPITLACWGYPLQTNQGCVLLSLSNGGSANGTFFIAFGSSGVAVANKSDNFGTGGAATTAAGYSANTWQHVCGVFASDTSRSIYLDGANKATNTTDTGDPSATNIAVGGRLNSSLGLPMNGRVAHAAIWTVALTDAEVASLYNNGIGADPRSIRPGSLWGYWPLLNADGDQDYWANYHLTTTASPTYAKHPPVLMRSRPRQVMPASASDTPPTITSVTLTGTSQIGQTLTATVVTDQDPVDSTEYQWQKAATDDAEPGTDISGETSQTLALTYADFGDLLDTAAYVRCQAIAAKNSLDSDEVASDWQAVTVASGGGSATSPLKLPCILD